MIGFKLFRLRKDGTLGPLFINARKRVAIGVKYPFEDHPTKGFAHRPGWHICAKPVAPHLSKKGRVWARVRFTRMATIKRPESQGGVWYLGSDMTVLGIC